MNNCTEEITLSVNMSNISSLFSNSTLIKEPFYQTGQVIFLGILFLFIFLANLSVLVILKKRRTKKSRMNFFIFHLAVADLSMGLMVVLVDILIRITIEWHGGIFMCKIVRFFQGVATFGSTYILVALSLDRVNAIARPLTLPRGVTKYWSVTVAWVTALLLSIPLFALSTVKTYEKMNIQQCTININGRLNWQIYVILTATAVFIVPAVIITVCYVIIIYVIYNSTNSRSEREVIRSLPDSTGKLTSELNSICPDRVEHKTPVTKTSSLVAGQKVTASGGIIPKARIKSVKMTFSIVLAFILCWSPYFVFDLLFVFNLIPEFKGRHALNIFIQSLAPLNSAANPLIYYIFKSRTKSTGLHCCNSRSQSNSVSRCQSTKHHHQQGCVMPMATQMSEAGLSRHNGEFIRMASMDKNSLEKKGSPQLTNQITPRRHSPTIYVKSSLSEAENELLLRHIEQKTLVVAVQ